MKPQPAPEVPGDALGEARQRRAYDLRRIERSAPERRSAVEGAEGQGEAHAEETILTESQASMFRYGCVGPSFGLHSGSVCLEFNQSGTRSYAESL